MKKIDWKNGTLVSKAKVLINGQTYEVEPEEYEGETPLSAENLNLMQDSIEESINGNRILNTTIATITQNTNYIVPQKYHVGKNDLWIFFEGTLLIKNENYIEIGVNREESTTIQFKDWDVPAGSKLEFLYK